MSVEIGYDTITGLVQQAQEYGCRISELVLRQQARQMEQPEQALYQKMQQRFAVMQQSAQQGMDEHLRSTSGLSGGSAAKMARYAESGGLCGQMFGNALAKALAVSELNAAMGRIVAAPTAGSCGILPAAILSVMEQRSLSERDCVLSLFTASAVGMVIANNACLAGAQGGCQAECGSASAMAAAALVELAGGSPQMAAEAVAIALKNILGLVCDPVAGLVEIPCIKRNAAGVANAFTAAELALAGIGSAIPADEVILAMKRVGDSMPAALRETAEGGLAATPTAQRLFQQVFGDEGKAGAVGCRACRSKD
ncbi:MAG: L-serine ammonia-lyase, iron-sulfur-dependent, subunit alpha [Anaerotruncus sp.]|nr:L-serine ammonia-lyase, iron-sulfur-dependent, subunit alpha [Anaerotruncus sp.]